MEKGVFWIRETEKGLMGRIQKANIKNMCKVKIFEKWQKTNRSVAKMKKEKQFTFSIIQATILIVWIPQAQGAKLHMQSLGSTFASYFAILPPHFFLQEVAIGDLNRSP